MVGMFSRTVLGLSALVIAAGCASSSSQQQRPGGAVQSNSTRDDLQSRSSGVIIQRGGDGGIRVSLAAGSNSFGATTYTPSNGSDRAPAQPVNVPLGSSQPLFLLDGVPYNPGPDGLLIGIDPYDIESIKAVRDPAQLSLYGMRAGNGIIAITTKRAKSDSAKQRPND